MHDSYGKSPNMGGACFKGHPMKLIPVLCGAILLSSASSLSAVAQEIGYVDLTDGPFRESSRHPRTFSGGCGGSDSRERQVTVTLLSVDRMIYPLGEQVTFELKIQNTGRDPVIVPWTPNLADLEPVDPNASYKYRIGVVLLTFKDPELREFHLSESLYGSTNVPGTLRALAPGQWFTVRGRDRTEPNSPDWGPDELREFGWVEAKVSGYFREDNGSYSPEHGGAMTAFCFPIRSESANELTVTLEQR
jgi:hypothetical protein